MENNETITNPSFDHYNQAKVLYKFIEHHGIKLSDEEFIKYFENQTGRNIEKCMPFVKSNADFPENIAMDGEKKYIAVVLDHEKKAAVHVIMASTKEMLKFDTCKLVKEQLKSVVIARIIEIDHPHIQIQTENKLM